MVARHGRERSEPVQQREAIEEERDPRVVDAALGEVQGRCEEQDGEDG